MSTPAAPIPFIEEEGLTLGPVAGAPGRVQLSGIGEAEGAAVLGRFLAVLHEQALAAKWTEVTLELERLEFINSSCLKAMVAWIYKVDTEGRPYTIRLIRDSSKHWQKTSLATLQRLAPSVVVIQDH